ncbi:MAG: RluA family pseudouridine synthase [Firmicutes bacterium]|nr:RluA family pseudouridine synthase [Bacillota bacterium]
MAVPPEADGWRADRALAHALGLSRARAAALFAAGEVTRGGRPLAADARVAAGDRLAVARTPASAAVPEGAPTPERLPLRVVYEDDDLLVVDKPAGMVVHPAAGHREGTLVNALLGRGGPLASQDPQRPGIVHRLDKDTSGLLVVAKEERVRRALSDLIARHEVERTYVAVVRGHLPAARGRVEAPLGRHPRDRLRQAVRGDGRPAVTHFAVLEQHARGAVVECRLETGRTHQIRVHLASLGCPVAGDPLYGTAADRRSGEGQLLHAARLAFPHPRDGRPVVCESPWPERILAARDRLRRGLDPLAPGGADAGARGSGA